MSKTGGIIWGFMGGAGQAAARVGELQFMNNLKKELDEANHLRDVELANMNNSAAASRSKAATDATKAENKVEREWKAGQNQADRESAEKIAGLKKTQGKPQLIKYTDGKGYEQEGVLKDNGDGTYNIIKPGTGEIVEESLTTEDLKNAAAVMNAESGKDDDWIPFNEYTTKDSSVRARALKEKEAKKSEDKGSTGGIIGSQMNPGDKEPKAKKPETGKPKVVLSREASKDPEKMYYELVDQLPEDIPDEQIIQAVQSQFPDWKP